MPQHHRLSFRTTNLLLILFLLRHSRIAADDDVPIVHYDVTVQEVSIFLVTMGAVVDSATTETPGGGDVTEGVMAAVPSDGAAGEGNDTMEEDNMAAAAPGGGNATMDTDVALDTGVDGDNDTAGVAEATMSPDTGTDATKDDAVPDNTVQDKDDTDHLDTKDEVKPPTDDTSNTLVPVPPVLGMPTVPHVHYMSAGPLCMTNADCNVTNYERCTKVKQDVSRCDCLVGHSRGSDGYTCVASKVYYVEVKTEQLITEQLRDHTSSPFRKFKYEATDGAVRALQLSKLAAILVDVRVSQLSAGPTGQVSVKYDVLLWRSYIPDRVVVTTDIRRAFLDNLVLGEDGKTVLDGTSIPITSTAAQTMELRDVDPCTHPLLNYCAPTALCIMSARSFTCQCRRGYTDTSPDLLQAPGEQCTLECGCKNGGECSLDDQGITKCSCPHWYLGHRCGVDVRILLITLAAVVAALLLLAVVCCACCLKYWRKKHRQTDDISSVYSLPRERVHMHKVTPSGGRQCYDTWRYYSFSPPAYHSAPGGKWQTVAHRPPQPHCPPFMACRRHPADMSAPIELVPPMYGTYGPIPRPHVLPSASMPRQHRNDSEWVLSTTGAEQDSSYA